MTGEIETFFHKMCKSVKESLPFIFEVERAKDQLWGRLIAMHDIEKVTLLDFNF